MMRTSELPWRRRTAALLLGIPTMIGALGVAALESWRTAAPDAPWFAAPSTASLADAIAAGDLLTTYELLRAGRDPQALLDVRDPIRTGGLRMTVSPLVWAVATESNQIVPLLLTLGATVEPAMRSKAVCLATQLGNDEVASLLTAHDDTAASEPCPVWDRATPVVPWLTGTSGTVG